MPPEDEFVEILGDFDQYPNYLLRTRVPEQYRYNWKTVPPIVNPSDLETYRSLIGPNAIVNDIAQLLGIPEYSTPAEECRIATYESLVNVYLQARDID